MAFSSKIRESIDSHFILKHPFYQDWNKGALEKSLLQKYASQYYHHVDAFPRYISSIHTNCKDIYKRQVLLDNLNDEEQGEENHPELWMRFAEELGCDRQEVQETELYPQTRDLIDSFFNFSRSSFAEGLAALYTYESQVPEVARVKIEGLKKFYDVNSDKGLKFFKVHQEADEWHAEECAKMLDQLNSEDQEKAQEAAKKTAQALWSFLDGVVAHA